MQTDQLLSFTSQLTKENSARWLTGIQIILLLITQAHMIILSIVMLNQLNILTQKPLRYHQVPEEWMMEALERRYMHGWKKIAITIRLSNIGQMLKRSCCTILRRRLMPSHSRG